MIADLVANGVTEEELERARHGVRAATIYAEDNPASLARTFGQALVLGETVSDVQHWPDKIAAVTVADVNAVARKYLDSPPLGHRLPCRRAGEEGIVMNAMKFARTLLAAVGIVIGFAGAANAVDVQRVVSPHGIEAWLVEDQSIPLIAMSFAFVGGVGQDPADKPGVANMLSGLLDEGAGDLDSQAYQTRLDDLSIGLSFDAGHDTFSGSLKTLTENRDEAARLLHLALTAPRFDQEPVERIRAQIMTGIRARERNPGEIASNALMTAVFPDHPYGRPTEGTLDSVAAITVDDLNAFRSRIFARDNLKVAVVGAIDAATLGAMLDEVFADLPATADLVPDTRGGTAKERPHRYPAWRSRRR